MRQGSQALHSEKLLQTCLRCNRRICQPCSVGMQRPVRDGVEKVFWSINDWIGAVKRSRDADMKIRPRLIA